MTPGVISPDGSTALVADPERNEVRMWLIDLDSGQRHAVDVAGSAQRYVDPGTMAWSPDGRWVLLVHDSAVLAVEARTRVVHRLELDLPEVTQVAVRGPR